MILIFDLLMIALIVCDCKLFKSLITPFTAICSVNLVLINLNNLFFCKIYGYNTVSDSSLLILAVYLAIIFLISFAFSLVFRSVKKSDVCIVDSYPSKKFVYILFFAGLIGYLLSMILELRVYGFGNIKGKSHGIFGHLGEIAFLMAPLLLKRSKNILSVLSVIALFVIAAVFGGKYVLCLNFIYLLLVLFYSEKIKKSGLIKIAFAAVIFGVIVFVAVYLVLPFITGNHALSLRETTEHFFYYLLAPVISNNHALQHNLPDGISVVFTVPINLFKAFTGNRNYVSQILPADFMFAEGKYTNVAGLIGESVYCLGHLGAAAYLVAVFIVIYVFYTVYRVKGEYKLLTCLLLTICFFSFFCNYFTSSGVVVPLFFAFVLESCWQAYAKKKTTKKRYAVQKNQSRSSSLQSGNSSLHKNN